MLWRTSIKASLAVALFALAHSALAAFVTKRRAEAWLGERRAAGLYRFGYCGISVLKLAVLFAYVHRLPDRPLYRVAGVPRLLLVLGQLSSLAVIVAAARQVGIGSISGLRQIADWRAGRPIHPTPVAQHPFPATHHELGWHGPYRLSSHPTNYFVLPAYWLSPTMTVKWAAVGVATTLYMVLGSTHEDRRLQQSYAERYARYRAQVPHVVVPVECWLRVRAHYHDRTGR